MTKLLWAAVIGAAISVVSLLGFMFLAASTMPNFKYIAPLFYVAATAALFWRMSRSFRLAGLLGLAVLTALGSLFGFQALDFWRTGGVLKGGFRPRRSVHLVRIGGRGHVCRCLGG